MMSYNNFGFNSTKPATANQLRYLKDLGYDGKQPQTSGEATLLLSELLNHWRDRDPSQAQLAFLKDLGYGGNPPKTRGEAHDLISKLKGNIPVPSLAIYSDHWSEGSIFDLGIFHEHSKEFYAAKEWRDSLDN